jgi:hypothetical protein
MLMRKTLIAVVATLAVAVGASSAEAGPPGKWTQVTGIGQDDLNIMRVGLARTGNGVLHVLWTRHDAGNAASVLHSAVSADAKSVTGPSTVYAATDGVNESVDVVRAADGSLRVFFAATNVFDSAMASATSADGGSWAVEAPVSRRPPQAKPVYAASGIGAGLGTDGTFYSIWGDSAPQGSGFHIGLDPNAADGDLPGGLKSDPDVGVDSQSGQVYAGWNSLDDEGVVVMPLNPGGARASIPNSAPQLQNRVGITGRIGAQGVFVAYAQGSNPFLADPAVYRIDSAATKRLTTKDGELVSIAAAPAGRLWVFWKDVGTIYATRSNKAATQWGRIVRVKAPKGSTTIYDLTGEGSRGPLDLLAHVDPPTGTLSSWHQRILPGLFFTTKKSKGNTVVKVTDAGAPVAGVTVKVKGDGSKKTGAGGTASFDLPAGRYKISAAKAGYASYSKRVRVK